MEPLVYIYADESCLGVQFQGRASPGGAAGLLAYWNGEEWTRRDYWVSAPDTTNNRMALKSAIEGLRVLKEPCRVVFTSDSKYLIDGMTEWVHGWVRRGWKRKRGKIKNERLWRTLVSASRRHEIDWRWVRGHAGHPQNEYANDLAVRAAKEQSGSGGLVPSGFTDWLEEQREQQEKYFDFFAFQPPDDEDEFEPTPAPPA